jgi:hypothetical protein
MKTPSTWASGWAAGLILSLSPALAATSQNSPPKDAIPLEKAQAAALKRVAGTVKESELEHEAGKWVYSFDILGRDKKIHEVWVDARNGKVTHHKIESSAEETREQKADQARSHP